MTKTDKTIHKVELVDVDDFFDQDFLSAFTEQHLEELGELEQVLFTAPEQGEKALADLESQMKACLHTLKGDSGTIGLLGIERVSHAMEDRLEASDVGSLTSEFVKFFDWIRDCVDCLEKDESLNISSVQFLETLEEGYQEVSNESSSTLSSDFLKEQIKSTRVQVSKLDQLMEKSIWLPWKL